MSPTDVFLTPDDFPYAVEIAAAGVCPASGEGPGVPVARAASRGVVELLDDDGELLRGKQLREAAARFADDRGLVVRSVKEDPDAAPEVARVPAPAEPDQTTTAGGKSPGEKE